MRRLTFILIIGTIGILSACQSSTKNTSAKDSSVQQPDHAGHMMHEATDADDYISMVNSGSIPEDTMKGSPKRVAMATVGGSHVHITYSAPGVKNRVIWGGLVPYGQVWVSGAHMATNVQVNHPIKIGDREVEPGTYALFTIPGKTSWQVMLNTDAQQHLADNYDSTKNVAQITLQPIWEEESLPRLTYKVEKVNQQEGKIVLRWERLRLEIPFTSMANK